MLDQHKKFVTLKNYLIHTYIQFSRKFDKLNFATFQTLIVIASLTFRNEIRGPTLLATSCNKWQN